MSAAVPSPKRIVGAMRLIQEASDVTIVEMCRETGIGRHTWSRLFDESREKYPSMSFTLQFCAFHSVSLDDVVELARDIRADTVPRLRRLLSGLQKYKIKELSDTELEFLVALKEMRPNDQQMALRTIRNFLAMPATRQSK